MEQKVQNGVVSMCYDRNAYTVLRRLLTTLYNINPSEMYAKNLKQKTNTNFRRVQT